MKKWIILSSLFVIMACLSQLTAAYQTRPTYMPIQEIVPVSILTPEKANDFFSGKTDLVIEFSAGSILPLNLQLKGEFLALNPLEKPYELKVLQTLFVRRDHKDFYFSRDLQHWQNFQEFFTGTLGLSLNVYDTSPQMDLSLEINHRS